MSSLNLVRRLGRNEESDECFTPANQISPLFNYLDKTKIYYEATSGKSSLILDAFNASKYNIIGSNGVDFFNTTSDDVYDGIITNPPYSKKDDFIEHCYKLGKPFALFLPVAAFQGKRRGNLFMKYGMSALVYNNRVDFTGKGQPHFGNAWFMWGFMPANTIHWVNNPQKEKLRKE
jgi:hypothetical protein